MVARRGFRLGLQQLLAAGLLLGSGSSCMNDRLEQNIDNYAVGGYELSHLLDQVDSETMNQATRHFYKQRQLAAEMLHLEQPTFSGIQNGQLSGIYLGSARDLHLRLNQYPLVSQAVFGQGFRFFTEPLVLGQQNSLVFGHATQAPRQMMLDVPLGFNLSPPVGFNPTTQLLDPDSALVFKWQRTPTGSHGQVLMWAQLYKRPSGNEAPELLSIYKMIPDVGEVDLSTQLDTTDKYSLRVSFYRFFGGTFDRVRRVFVNGQLREGYEMVFYEDRSIID